MQSITSNINQKSCNIRLNISLKSPLPADENLYITGNLPQLGSWNPSGSKLEPTGHGTYCINLKAEKNCIIECKITRGSWKTQGIFDLCDVPPSNLVIKVQHDNEINIKIIDWLDKQIIESDPVTGNITASPEFPCKGLKFKRGVQI